MYKNYVWPEITVLDYISFTIILLVFLISLFLIIRYLLNQSKKEKFLLIKALCSKFNFNEYQIELVKKLFIKLPYLNVNYFFYNESYFDESLDFFLNKIKASEKIKDDFSKLKEKINFFEQIPSLSKEIPVNQNVKIRLNRIGFISAKIIDNDEDGILVTTYFKDAIDRVAVKDNVVIYYWDDNNQYEIHSKIKRVAKINFIQYILIYHANLKIKNKETQGFSIDQELPVYFTHIFKLPKEFSIESHYFKGNINTFSMIGAEIFTKFKVTSTGVFLFEFHPIGNDTKRFHFTAKIVEHKRVNKGNLLFFKYIDMNEECKKYIYAFIVEKLNKLH